MNCQAIFDEATAAADAAIKTFTEKYGHDVGCCGFAWVIITPARGKFITWCKAQIAALVAAAPDTARDRHMAKQNGSRKFGDNGCYGGWQIWSPGLYHGQSIDAKEAGAAAFADVLSKHGINASMHSRMD